jgi:hypothetical protein
MFYYTLRKIYVVAKKQPVFCGYVARIWKQECLSGSKTSATSNNKTYILLNGVIFIMNEI